MGIRQDSTNVPALVVGAGPVGMTLAADLTRQGIECRIIDKSPEPTDKSKALVVWPRSMEVLADLGCAPGFLTTGGWLDGVHIYAGRKRVMEASFEPADSRYTKPLLLPQSETERLLREHLQRRGVEIERPVELMRLLDHGDRVEANLRHADGREETVVCDWLLGCDGAHSAVRKQLGIEFTGEFEPNDWALVDCQIRGPIHHSRVVTYWHSSGILAFFPFGDGRFRIIMDMGKASDSGRPATPTLEQVQEAVNRRGPQGLTLYDAVWLSGFRIHERKVANYRKGRCFLAGDAAHIHSPAGGQGMNTGMQDAYNLAWKLAAVHLSGANPSLLDSYSAERSAVGEMVLANAGKLTRLAMMQNPVGRFFRNRAISLAGRLAAVQRKFTYGLTELGVNYPHSPLNGPDDGTGWGNAPKPGDRLPDADLLDGQRGTFVRLHDAIGSGRFSLLLFAEKNRADLDDIARQVESSHGDVVRVLRIFSSAPASEGNSHVDTSGALRRRLGIHAETAAIVVRPDGYIAYRGQPASYASVRRCLERYFLKATRNDKSLVGLDASSNR